MENTRTLNEGGIGGPDEKQIEELIVAGLVTMDSGVPFDCCVMCKFPTPYKTATPIVLRKNYLSGVGQLCSGCGKKFAVN